MRHHHHTTPAAAIAAQLAEIDLALMILQGAKTEIESRQTPATWGDVAEYSHLVDGLHRADLQPHAPAPRRRFR